MQTECGQICNGYLDIFWQLFDRSRLNGRHHGLELRLRERASNTHNDGQHLESSDSNLAWDTRLGVHANASNMDSRNQPVDHAVFADSLTTPAPFAVPRSARLLQQTQRHCTSESLASSEFEGCGAGHLSGHQRAVRGLPHSMMCRYAVAGARLHVLQTTSSQGCVLKIAWDIN